MPVAKPDLPAPAPLPAALGLALAAAVSLGLSRFAYALLLPLMRVDLDWSYATAGAMNTINALGYLTGALLLPRLQRQWDTLGLLILGGLGACLSLALTGLVRSPEPLLLFRGLSGVFSALSFAGGGLLIAQLAMRPDTRHRSGLLLGIYYGGAGLGIVASSLWMQALSDALPGSGQFLGLANWQWGWLGLAGLAGLGTLVTIRLTRGLSAPASPSAGPMGATLRPLRFGLLGYLMFGLGYIGYMTFVIGLLAEQGYTPLQLTAFFVLLGLGVLASSFCWARLLQTHRNGRPMSLLNGLLALACVLPVISTQAPILVYGSGLLFGGVFLSVVASTTALVRHNLPQASWPAGIAAFTTIFAVGQILGPLLVGWVADLAGGLAPGFLLSGLILGLGSLLAARQRAVPQGPDASKPAGH